MGNPNKIIHGVPGPLLSIKWHSFLCWRPAFLTLAQVSSSAGQTSTGSFQFETHLGMKRTAKEMFTKYFNKLQGESLCERNTILCLISNDKQSDLPQHKPHSFVFKMCQVQWLAVKPLLLVTFVGFLLYDIVYISFIQTSFKKLVENVYYLLVPFSASILKASYMAYLSSSPVIIVST